MLNIETEILKQLLQKLWRSKLSYRECSTVKQSIKDLLQCDLPDNAGKEVIAEVNRVVIFFAPRSFGLNAISNENLH